ncbi:MAG TPA: carboxymuconolactone decarboxylase family protein [Acidimicrobiia bacterium]|jgi:alkylhydroperoxidase family enzyme
MPRISYRPYEHLDESSRRYLDHARDHGTPRPESQAVRAHVPAVLRAFSEAWLATFEDGVLDNAIKELCRLYVSKTVDCEYCGAQRSELARSVVNEIKVDELVDFERSDKYDDRERTALRYAQAIAWDAGLADDRLWEDLHRHFTEPELVELGFFIGLTLGQQRWIKTMNLGHREYMATSDAGLASPSPA